MPARVIFETLDAPLAIKHANTRSAETGKGLGDSAVYWWFFNPAEHKSMFQEAAVLISANQSLREATSTEPSKTFIEDTAVNWHHAA